MGYWFHMCLSQEASIRVSTLKNHLIQNNQFTRVIFPEIYLHPRYQRPIAERIFRLGLYLATLLCAVGNISTWEMGRIESNALRRVVCDRNCQTSSFPRDQCSVQMNRELIIEGNRYTDIFDFQYPKYKDDINANKDYQQCLYYALEPEEEGRVPIKYWVPERRERQDICFTKCRRRNESPKPIKDFRNNCPKARSQEHYDSQFGPIYHQGKDGNITWMKCDVATEECDIFNNKGLTCIHPEDGYDNAIYAYSICFGDEDGYVKNSWCLDFLLIGLIIVVSNVVFFIIDMLWFLSSSLPNGIEVFHLAVLKMATQSTLLMFFVCTVIFNFGPFYKSQRANKENAIHFIFLISLVLDQFKSVFVQIMIYHVIILRCGWVRPGIQEYNEKYIASWEPEESLYELLQRKVREFLSWKPMVLLTTHGLVGGYSIYIMLQLATADLLNEYKNLVLGLIYLDLAFNVVFVIELCFRIFAWGPQYLYDYWNLFDTFVICGQMWLWSQFNETVGGPRGFGLLRLIKLVRLMIVVRRSSEGRKKLKSLEKTNTTGYEIGTQVDKVLQLVDELQLQSCLSQFLKEDLEWFTEITVNNKLYKVSVEETSENEGDNSALAWLKNMNDNQGVQMDKKAEVKASKINGNVGTVGNLTSKESAIILGTRIKATKVDEKKESLEFSLMTYISNKVNLSKAEEGQIESCISHIDEWTMDMLTASEVLATILIPFVFLHCTHPFEVSLILNLDYDLLYNYLTISQERANSSILFHNNIYIAQMVQATFVFLKKFGLESFLDPVEIFGLFTACIVSWDSCPGLSNDFLVNARHPSAVRYNDISIIQHHNLSEYFTLMRDPELNMFCHTPPEKYEYLRKIIITIVLRLDPRKHFEELSLFKTKLASDFPLPDSQEDKLVLLAISLRMIDLSWTCRCLQQYSRWADKFLEEMMAQGDLEKQMGLPVSPFCDKDIVNAKKAQLGYLVVIVHPLTISFGVFINSPAFQKEFITDGLDANRAYYKTWIPS